MASEEKKEAVAADGAAAGKCCGRGARLVRGAVLAVENGLRRLGQLAAAGRRQTADRKSVV